MVHNIKSKIMEIITVCGLIGRDAVMGPNDKRDYVQFTVAADRYVGKENGGDDKGRQAAWYTVFAYGSRYANLSKYLTKGRQVVVVGEYSDNVYQSKKTGDCEVGRTIRANNIKLCSGAGETPEDDRMPKLEPKAEPQPAPAPKPTKSVATEPDDDLPF